MGAVRLELHDVDYDNTDDVPISEQKKNLLENKYITKKLRGTVKLFDNDTNQLLEEKRLSLMRVPYLTNRGTFIHGGNEYATIMQARLLPGVYTRRQANGELETQFNVKPGTGVGFRVGFEPETTQYRLKISQANLHLYSLLKDLGTKDEELEKAWGPDIFNANKNKYDSRVFDKAYERLVSNKQKKIDVSREDKAKSIRNALDSARIHARVAQKNLPSMFNPKIAAEWQARWEGKQAAEKVASTVEFKPDLTPEEVLNDYGIKSAANIRHLNQARQHSANAKLEYKKKTAIMAAALANYPDEFIVDSPGRMSGITHVPTGFRIHVPSEIIPTKIKRVFAEHEETIDPEVDKIATALAAAGASVPSKPNTHRWLSPSARRPLGRIGYAPPATNSPAILADPVPAPLNTPLTPQYEIDARKDLLAAASPVKAGAAEPVLTDHADMWDTRSNKFRLVDVQKLIELTKGRKPEQINIDRIWGGEETSPGFSEERLNETDTQHPILVDDYKEGDDKDVGLVDGRHRKIKLKRQGVTMADIIRLTHADLDGAAIEETKQASEDFSPDLEPDELTEAYNAIYGHHGPQLASMKSWPKEWLDDTNPMGWLQWYEQYAAGARGDTDERQIKRWKSFKARHGAQFKKNPTPRRGWALRNWAIDPLKLIDDEPTRGTLAKAMEEYKNKAWQDYTDKKDD